MHQPIIWPIFPRIRPENEKKNGPGRPLTPPPQSANAKASSQVEHFHEQREHTCVSFCHSVHNGRGSLCQHAPHITLPGVLCPGWSLSRGVWVQGGDLGPGGFLSRGSLSRGVSVRGVSVWGVSVQGVWSLSRGRVSVQGDLCQGDPRMVTSGWYASSWNALLFQEEILSQRHCFKILKSQKVSTNLHYCLLRSNYFLSKWQNPYMYLNCLLVVA